MINYDEILESLMNRVITVNAIVIVFSLVVLLSVWLFPLIQKCVSLRKKSKKKKSVRKKDIIKTVVAEILVTAIILPICCFNIANLVEQYKKVKADIENQSYITYTGKYELDAVFVRTLSDLVIDLRDVQIEGSDDFLLLDMSKVNEGLVRDYGIYEGTIVYAENSRYILLNDAERIGDEW